MEIHVGDEKRLKATIEPSFFEDKEVSWKTSNNSIVSIDDKGNRADITGLKSGVATITATVDGVSASCQVTVVNCDYSQKIVEAEYLASPASCISQATYYYVCECGDKGRATYKIGELAEHTYSDWTTIKAATETTVGIEQRTCSGCKHTEERQIPALPHTHEYGEVVFAWAKDYSSVIASVTCDKCPDGNSEKTLSTNCEVFFDDTLDNRLIVSADGMLNGEYVTDALVIRVLNKTLMMPMKPAEKMMILIAGYNEQGRVVDFQIETEPDKNVAITSTCSVVKVFFLNEETYEPLLPALLGK